MKKLRVLLPIVLIFVLILTLTMFACKPKEEEQEKVNETLVVGYAQFSNKFSPFFATTAYDSDVASMTQLGLLSTDRVGAVVYKGIAGETRNYNGTDYLYTGIADIEVDMNEKIVEFREDGTVVKEAAKPIYTITMRDDLKFSDGTAVTIDDVIFSMYVLSDLKYNGSSTFNTLPIKGMNDYRYDVKGYDKYAGEVNNILAAGSSKETPVEGVTEEQISFVWNSVADETKAFAQDIIDVVAGQYITETMQGYGYMGKYTVEEIKASEPLKNAYGMVCWGFGEWEDEYVVDAEVGTYGKIIVEEEEEFVDLYKQVTESTEDAVEGVDGKFYIAIDADTEDTDFFTVVDSEDENKAGKVVATTYAGNRYVNRYTGKFVDRDKNVYSFEEESFPTAANYWTNIINKYAVNAANYTNADIIKATDKEGTGRLDVMSNVIGAYVTKYAEKATINNIEGIKRLGDYKLEISMTSFDATAIYKLGVSVAPKHYYGDVAQYNYAQNKFGFPKGDLSLIESKTTTPMGAGPYKFVSYEQGVVTFERNDLYYKGAPKVKYIQFKETEDADKIPGVVAGTFDVTDPSFNQDAVALINRENGGPADLSANDPVLSGSKVVTSTVENLGYGYIGINANNVNVDGNASSEASKNLRKGFATAIAYYREVAVNSYYGPRASVIQYPISNTSWAAPRPSDGEGNFEIAYSTDIYGQSIYTADMTMAQQKAAAKAAAIGFLKAAGYTFDDAEGKFTTAPTGAKMTYEIIVPGDGKGDHPSFSICTKAKELLDEIGIELTINDPANANVLWDKLESGHAELWCAAWSATVDPDMEQVYHSNNVVGKGGTDSNHYAIADENLDRLIKVAKSVDDNDVRKAYYKECLDIILDWGVEIPTYQRQNAVVFSPERIKMETITPDITTFWGWMNDIENIELK